MLYSASDVPYLHLHSLVYLVYFSYSSQVWMLTGDKAETAACIGVSSRLCDRDQTIYTMICSTKRELLTHLQNFSAQVSLLFYLTSSSFRLIHLSFYFHPFTYRLFVYFGWVLPLFPLLLLLPPLISPL